VINEPTITISGNLTADAELRYTPTGIAAAAFTVASNPRIRDTDGAWQDGEPLFYRVTAWRDEAENIVESLRKGDPVIIIGRERANVWEDKHGQARRDHVVTADSVSVPLARHRVRLIKVTRAARSGEPQDGTPGPAAAQEPDGQPEPGSPAAARSEPQEASSPGTAPGRAGRTDRRGRRPAGSPAQSPAS
jgi:single-strand DNA-binding protein